MSDQQPSSPVNLFKTLAPSSGSGQSFSREITSGKPVDKAFSRELSKANERAVERPSEQRSARSNERPGERPTERTESSRRSESSAKNENETRTEQKKTHRPDGPRRTDNRSDKVSEQSTEKESIAGTETSTDVSNKVSETAEKTASEIKAEPVAEQIVFNSEQAKQEALQSADSEGTELDVQPQADELVASGDKNRVESKIESTDVEVTDKDQVVDPVIETEVTESETVVSTVVPQVNEKTSESLPTANVNTPVAGSTQGSDVDSEKPSVQRLTVGEQLSPTQLANRQTHLFNNVGTRPSAATAVTGQQPAAVNVVDVDAGDEAARLTTVAVIATAQMAGVPKVKNANSVSGSAQVIDDVSGKPSLVQAITGEPSAEQLSAKNKQADDVEAAANLTANLAARKADQQSIQNNQAQTRQASQQQVQNLNTLTAAIASEPAERANQSTDNMFLSLPGGIVTAPVVQRPDAGNSQTINAPINMPILQNDADKAMAGNIRWMVNEGVKNAVVNVTPSGMGPISVSIGIEKDQMNISIVALQGSTREAMDSMLPRLKEQFAAQGQDNVRVDISDGRAEQSDRGYGQQFTGEQGGSEQDDHRLVNQKDDDELDGGSAANSELTGRTSQGLITINENGQIRSRYDAYV